MTGLLFLPFHWYTVALVFVTEEEELLTSTGTDILSTCTFYVAFYCRLTYMYVLQWCGGGITARKQFPEGWISVPDLARDKYQQTNLFLHTLIKQFGYFIENCLSCLHYFFYQPSKLLTDSCTAHVFQSWGMQYIAASNWSSRGGVRWIFQHW